jgi:hypothetical protein
MTPEDKLNTLIQHYSRIERFPKKYKEILNIDKPLRWILADENDQYISVYKKTQEQKILDIDISSCFPTVCNFLFTDTNLKFVEDIAKQPTKLDKNIFIANTLKTTNYLKILNIISKMVILGYVFDRQDSDDISLLEFEKDGCLIFINDIVYFKNIQNQNIDSPFLEFIKENNFIFHMIEYEYYIRCNNTSWYWSDKTRIKGKYKHVPQEILKLYDDIFTGNSINIKKYIDIYNETAFNFIKANALQEILKKYYFCDDENKILTQDGKYAKYDWRKSLIDPFVYQKTFIFPVWVFRQRNLSGIT